MSFERKGPGVEDMLRTLVFDIPGRCRIEEDDKIRGWEERDVILRLLKMGRQSLRELVGFNMEKMRTHEGIRILFKHYSTRRRWNGDKTTADNSG
jgi:hypothetical protein